MDRWQIFPSVTCEHHGSPHMLKLVYPDLWKGGLFCLRWWGGNGKSFAGCRHLSLEPQFLRTGSSRAPRQQEGSVTLPFPRTRHQKLPNLSFSRLQNLPEKQWSKPGSQFRGNVLPRPYFLEPPPPLLGCMQPQPAESVGCRGEAAGSQRPARRGD